MAIMFRYKYTNSFIHKIPAWIKILLIFPFSISTMYISFEIILSMIVIIAILAFICGFSPREQFLDINPVKYYFLFLYSLTVFTNLTTAKTFTANLFIPSIEMITSLIKLVLIMQFCTLLFRTTTSLELKSGIEKIERVITNNTHFSKTFSLFLNFIPEVFALWNQLTTAWKARGGKNGVKKIKTLTPLLISLSLHKAHQKSQALTARQ